MDTGDGCDEDFPPLGRSTVDRGARQPSRQGRATFRGRAGRPPQLTQHAPLQAALHQPVPYRVESPDDTNQSMHTLDDLDRLAADSIRQLHREGKHASVHAVEQLMLNRLGCKRLPLVRYATEVPHLKQLDRELSRIQAFIYAYKLNSICTVHELGQKLAASAAAAKSSFDDLGIGPLTKIPQIYDLFKCPSDGAVAELTPADVVSYLRKCLDDPSYRSEDRRLKVEEFLTKLAEANGCKDDTFRLGVKIKSIPLLIQEVSRARREANSSLREARERIHIELQDELTAQLHSMKRHFAEALDRKTDRGVVLRRKYLHMLPLEVLQDALQCCMDYITNKRVKDKVTSVLCELSKDPLASQLFQLALCSAHYTVDDSSAKYVNAQPGGATVATSLENTTAGVTAAQQQRKRTYSQKEVFGAIKRSLTLRKVELISLEVLKGIEEHTKKALEVKDFVDCGHGSFVAFLCRYAKDFEDGGTSLILSADSGTGLQDLKKQALAFIRHYCSIVGRTSPFSMAEQHELSTGLLTQFGVTNLQELGASSLPALLSQAGQARGGSSISNSGPGTSVSLAGLEQPVLFEEACVRANIQDDSTVSGSNIAVSHDRHAALQCIVNTPLLEDVSSWTQWKLVFYDTCGDLTKFIMENYKEVQQKGKDLGEGASFGLRVIASGDGRLLRIPASGCDVETFAACVAKADGRGAAANLTGIASSKGVAGLPLLLLAGHVQKKLTEMASLNIGSCRSKQLDDCALYAPLTDFVLTAIVLLPLQIARRVARQVFVAPFADATGSQTKAEELLHAMSTQRGLGQAMERLGLLLGVSRWTAPYDKKLEPLAAFDDTSAEVVETLSLQCIPEAVPGSSEAPILGHVGNKAAHVSKVQDEAPHDVSLPVDGVTEHDQTATTRAGDGHCLAVINDIRKKYDVDCSHEESEATSNLKKQLGNSLERLSRELYNSNTHFVLELIQNADDNHYGKDTSPAVLFVIDNNSIVLYNNEEGFSEKDVRAISAIGMSTKGKHKQGYIGQKGIGFKSVFTVTERPEVHSNGYHICFDRSQGNIGYILPTWVPDKPPSPPKEHSIKGSSSWKTTIVLPLKDESDDDRCRVQALTSSFLDFKPILLLFLHRLQQITFVIKAQKRTVVMRRRDVNKHLLQLYSGNDPDLWLVSRLQLDTAEELQVDVDSTELSLAFPVFSDPKHYVQYLTKPEKKPKKQQTFAYLPLREFGFKFVLQADFEIPSSRQDVRHDSRWNEWLREAIPRAFTKSRELFLGLNGLDQIAATIYFLKFTPLPGEISGFFEPVAQGILQQLCCTALMPVQEEKDVISWKLPSEVIICPKEVQSVLPASMLTSKLGLFYVMPRILDGLGEELLMNLGVKKLDCFTAVELLKVLYHDYHRENSSFPMKHCALWLSTMYHFLSDGYQSSAIATIAAMKLFWLSNGSVVSLSDDQAVFLPPSANDAKGSSVFDVLASDLPIISKDLLGCQSELANAQVKEVLQILGVRTPTVSEIINDHIMPTLRSDAWKNKPKKIMVTYVRFLFNDWVNNRAAEWLPASKKCLRLLTMDDKFVCPAEDDIYLTPHYHNPVDLQKSYPARTWCLISAEYTGAMSSAATPIWKDFFLAHGLKEMFEVQSQRSVRTRTDLEKTSWHSFLDLLPADSAGELELEDYDCPVLRQLIESGDATTLTSVYSELQGHWDSKYEGMQHAVLRMPSPRPPIRLPSTFVHLLRSRRWVPCTTLVPRQLTGSQWDCELRSDFEEPSAVWLDTAELRRLLGHTVTYLRGRMPSTAFSRAMGFQCELPATLLLDHLRKWAAGTTAASPLATAADASAAERQQQFVTSLQHMTNVYIYLMEHAPAICTDAFQNEALVFVPSSLEHHEANDLQVGNFLPLRSLRWTDPTGLFKEYRPEFISETTGEKLSYAFIDQYYDGLGVLFVTGLRIDQEPLLRDYCLLLQHIAQQDPKMADKSVEHATDLYVALGRKCVTETQEGFIIDRRYSGQLQSYMRDAPVFATLAGSWTQLNERLLLDDCPELGDLLRQDRVPVSFIKFIITGVGNVIPRPNSYLMAFCEALGIRNLSSLVEKEAVHEGLRSSPRAQNYVASLLPWVHRFMLSKEAYRELYTRLTTPSAEDGSVFPDSRLRSVYQVKSIQVVLRLKGWDECTVKRSRECDYVDSDRSIYLEYKFVDDMNDMCYYVNTALISVLRADEGTSAEFKERLSDYLSAAKDFVVHGRPRTEAEFIRRHGLKPCQECDQFWTLPSLHESPPQPEAPPHLDLSSLGTDSPGNGFFVPSDSEHSASEGAGSTGLTCWPPRQFEAGQGHGPARGAAVPRPELPEFAKNPPPRPPSDEVAIVKTLSDAATYGPEGRPITTRSGKRTGNNDSESPANGEPKTRASASASAAAQAEPHHAGGRTAGSGSGEAPAASADQQPKQQSGSRKRAAGPAQPGSEAACSSSGTVNEEPAQGSPVSSDPSVLVAPSDGADGTVELSLSTDSGSSRPPGHASALPVLPSGIDFSQLHCLSDMMPMEKDMSLLLSKLNLELFAQHDCASDHAIGRRGELCVYHYLMKKYESEIRQKCMNIVWVNAKEETGLPYDIAIHELAKKSYIEVKSTRTEDKCCMELSSNQLQFALTEAENYSIYRVYNAGSTQVTDIKLRILLNLAGLLNEKKVGLFIII